MYNDPNTAATLTPAGITDTGADPSCGGIISPTTKLPPDPSAWSTCSIYTGDNISNMKYNENTTWRYTDAYKIFYNKASPSSAYPLCTSPTTKGGGYIQLIGTPTTSNKVATIVQKSRNYGNWKSGQDICSTARGDNNSTKYDSQLKQIPGDSLYDSDTKLFDALTNIINFAKTSNNNEFVQNDGGNIKINKIAFNTKLTSNSNSQTYSHLWPSTSEPNNDTIVIAWGHGMGDGGCGSLYYVQNSYNKNTVLLASVGTRSFSGEISDNVETDGQTYLSADLPDSAKGCQQPFIKRVNTGDMYNFLIDLHTYLQNPLPTPSGGTCSAPPLNEVAPNSISYKSCPNTPSYYGVQNPTLNDPIKWEKLAQGWKDSGGSPTYCQHFLRVTAGECQSAREGDAHSCVYTGTSGLMQLDSAKTFIGTDNVGTSPSQLDMNNPCQLAVAARDLFLHQGPTLDGLPITSYKYNPVCYPNNEPVGTTIPVNSWQSPSFGNETCNFIGPFCHRGTTSEKSCSSITTENSCTGRRKWENGKCYDNAVMWNGGGNAGQAPFTCYYNSKMVSYSGNWDSISTQLSSSCKPDDGAVNCTKTECAIIEQKASEIASNFCAMTTPTSVPTTAPTSVPSTAPTSVPSTAPTAKPGHSTKDPTCGSCDACVWKAANNACYSNWTHDDCTGAGSEYVWCGGSYL